MGSLNLRLPESIHRHVEEIAEREGISIDLFINSAVSEKISALTTEEYVANRATRAGVGPNAFKGILDRVPHREPLPGDEF
uniref:HicB family protein n=1 Tax=Candidatus Kentrum sp. FM TaxID=2126340 RepID=A0A450RWH6_9GAMM|nr:MAG: HicB family protein [Candidatus Kentron sp. FM]VFJ43877.1 MAG: HicB family protein [Candidatus Kentron sp. FM]VFK05751.1 MAG: HicB family protein [Candidatus Kentron sp. FM]